MLYYKQTAYFAVLYNYHYYNDTSYNNKDLNDLYIKYL